MKHKSDGFTVIELLVTVAMAAIIVTMAVPSLRSLVQDNRSATAGNSFLTALNLARATAVQSSVPVSICPKDSASQTCSTQNDWITGWIVFKDADDNGALASSSDILRVFRPLQNGAVMKGDCIGSTSSTCPTFVTFEPTGALNLDSSTSGITFSIQFPDCTGQSKRIITLNPQGRPASATAAC